MPFNVLYLDDIPTPYRMHVHNEITRRKIFAAYRVLFCADKEPGRTWDFDFSGLDSRILKGFQFRPIGQINPFSFKVNFGILKEMKEFRPDVVIFAGYSHPTIWIASWWCRRNGVPYGITCETSDHTSIQNKSMKQVLKNIIVKPIVKNLSFGLPVSQAAGRYLRKISENGELPLFHFPNTPDVDKIATLVTEQSAAQSMGECCSSFSIPVHCNYLIFVGRLITAKRPLDVLAAYRALSKEVRANNHLVFAGDGPLMTDLQNLAKDLGTVHFLGWVRDTEMLLRLIAGSIAMVLPSEHEPWGAVVNEAMACGTVVVASQNVGAAIDMIQHGTNGYLMQCGDVEGLRCVLQQVLEHPNLTKLQEAALITARQFGHEFAIQNLLNAVNQAVRT